MPSDITTPAATDAVSRLTLTTDAVRGAQPVATCCFCPCACCVGCFADDAE